MQVLSIRKIYTPLNVIDFGQKTKDFYKYEIWLRSPNLQHNNIYTTIFKQQYLHNNIYTTMFYMSYLFVKIDRMKFPMKILPFKV